MKKYTFTYGTRTLFMRPTKILCLSGENDAGGEKIYFAYIKDFKDQNLTTPYVWICTENGNNEMGAEVWLDYDAAQNIFEFFAAVDQGRWHSQTKKYTFTTPKKIKISFSPNLIIGMRNTDRKAFTLTFAYVKNFKDQKLQGPYIQMDEIGKVLAAETYYSHAEAKKILSFFTEAHMLGPNDLKFKV